MRQNPLLIAMFALLIGAGGAVALWVVDDTQQRSRCAAPALPQDALDETPAPTKAQPLPDHALDRPLQPTLQPAPAEPKPGAQTSQPAPKPPADLILDVPGKVTQTGIVELGHRDLTEQDLQRLRDLAAEMAKRMEEEELAKYPFLFTASISGTVFDSAGLPVAGAQVLLGNVEKFTPGSEPETERLRKSVDKSTFQKLAATTDAAGNFSIEFKRGYNREVESMNFHLSAVGADKTRGDRVEFSLRTGETRAGLRLELPGTGSVTGRVVTANGAAVVGAQVMAQLDAPAGNKAAPGRLGGGAGQWVATDAQGRFVIPALLDGRYVLRASCAGYAQQAGEVSAIVTSGRETDLGTDMVLVLETALKITLTCAAHDPQGQGMVATFFDGQGNRISASSARVGPGGVTLFGKAPTSAVSFEISGGVYVPTNRIACSLVEGAHYDAGTLELTMREMPRRGNTYDGKDEPPTTETVKIRIRD